MKYAIKPKLSGKNKPEIIQELSFSISDIIAVDPQTICEEVLQREQMGSTGIGGGVGIPHCRLPIKELSLAFCLGIQHAGVEFDSMDNQYVFIFVLLVFSTNISSNIYLKSLSTFARFLREESIRRRLILSESVEEIQEIIQNVIRG